MNNLNNNQRDPKWANILLGFGDVTIGADGCTISVIGDALGTTPDVVNNLLKQFGGFEGSLVIWDKIAEAFPGVSAMVYNNYDNNAILQALTNGSKVLIAVSSTPIGGTGMHWVEYIGNHQLKDPWTGTIRPTSDFPDVLGEWVELKGVWNQAPQMAGLEATPPPDVPPPPSAKTASVGEVNAHGLDITNSDSLQVALDTWYNVSQGLYEPISSYNNLKASYEALLEEKNTLQNDHNALNTEFTKTKGLLATVTQEDYDYSQKALDAGKLADSYEKDLETLYDKLDLPLDIQDPQAVQQAALARIDSYQKAQTVTPGEAEKTLSLWEGFFLKIAQSALNHGLNDYLKSVGKQIVDLDNKPDDTNIGDNIVAFLEEKFKDASLVVQAQQQMASLKQNIAKTQPFLVKLGYALKGLIFVDRTVG